MRQISLYFSFDQQTIKHKHKILLELPIIIIIIIGFTNIFQAMAFGVDGKFLHLKRFS